MLNHENRKKGYLRYLSLWWLDVSVAKIRRFECWNATLKSFPPQATAWPSLWRSTVWNSPRKDILAQSFATDLMFDQWIRWQIKAMLTFFTSNDRRFLQILIIQSQLYPKCRTGQHMCISGQSILRFGKRSYCFPLIPLFCFFLRWSRGTGTFAPFSNASLGTCIAEEHHDACMYQNVISIYIYIYIYT